MAELINKGILIVNVHNKERLIVEITLTSHPRHHPAIRTDIHTSWWVAANGKTTQKEQQQIPRGTNIIK